MHVPVSIIRRPSLGRRSSLNAELLLQSSLQDILVLTLGMSRPLAEHVRSVVRFTLHEVRRPCDSTSQSSCDCFLVLALHVLTGAVSSRQCNTAVAGNYSSATDTAYWVSDQRVLASLSG